MAYNNEIKNSEMSLDQVLWECFRHFVHLDEANAAIHCAQVRYSPLTFRLATALDEVNREHLHPSNVEILNAVLRDMGKYTEDPGR